MRLRNIYGARVDGHEPGAIVIVDDAERASRMLATKLFVDADTVDAGVTVNAEGLAADKARRNAEAARFLGLLGPSASTQEAALALPSSPDALEQAMLGVGALRSRNAKLETQLADAEKLIEEATAHITSLETQLADAHRLVEQATAPADPAAPVPADPPADSAPSSKKGK